MYSVPALIVKCGANKERTRSEKEEDITNAIIKVTHTEEKSLYFLTGHGERDINGETDAFGMGIIKRLLEDKRYSVKEFEMSRQQGIPEDCAVLVIAAPQTDLFEHELTALERYLNLGGNVIVLLEPETAPQLAAWLAKYGLKVGNEIICEAEVQADIASLLQGKLSGRLSVSTAPVIGKRNYGTHEITRDFDLATQYPSSRSVSVTDTLPAGITADKILETKGELENAPDASIPGSWAETDLEMLRQQQAQYDEGVDMKGPVTLAALVTIDRHNFEPAKAAEAAVASATDIQRPDKSRLLVFGDSDFATNSGVRYDRGVLFTNCINYLIGA
ncbi:MAG TPA: Gldg family protein, partial [bacterium]|nr:Gldg family protein [bacterium]